MKGMVRKTVHSKPVSRTARRLGNRSQSPNGSSSAAAGDEGPDRAPNSIMRGFLGRWSPSSGALWRNCGVAPIKAVSWNKSSVPGTPRVRQKNEKPAQRDFQGDEKIECQQAIFADDHQRSKKYEENAKTHVENGTDMDRMRGSCSVTRRR